MLVVDVKFIYVFDKFWRLVVFDYKFTLFRINNPNLHYTPPN